MAPITCAEAASNGFNKEAHAVISRPAHAAALLARQMRLSPGEKREPSTGNGRSRDSRESGARRTQTRRNDAAKWLENYQFDGRFRVETGILGHINCS